MMSLLLDSNIGFAIFGTLVIFTNIIVLITFTSSSKLMKKYLFLIALSLGDISAGIAAFSSGYSRALIYEEVPVPNETTVLDCMKSPPIPLIIIGGQWPALLIFFIGVERLLAVFKPFFYRSTYKNKHRILFIASSVAIFLFYLSCAYGQRLIFGGMDTIVPIICLTTPTFLPIFDTIHRVIVVFGNLAGFVFNLIALLYARHMSKTSGAHGQYMRSEARRINVLLTVSGFCVLQSTIPQLIFWASVKDLFVFPGNTAYYNAAVFYTGSLVNFFIYILLKKDFRARLVHIFTFGSVGNCVNEVTTTTVQSIPVNRHLFPRREVNQTTSF